MEVTIKSRKKRKLPKAVKGEEFVKLMKVIPEKDKLSKTAFVLAYGSGLRVGEITKLQKENVDVQRKSISVWGGKGGVDRPVPLPKMWRGWMLDYIPINITVRSLERRFNKYRDKVGLPKFYTFHSLRHGFATRLIEQGVPITHVQVLLGHSDVSTTGVYIKARPMDALKSYEESF